MRAEKVVTGGPAGPLPVAPGRPDAPLRKGRRLAHAVMLEVVVVVPLARPCALFLLQHTGGKLAVCTEARDTGVQRAGQPARSAAKVGFHS